MRRETEAELERADDLLGKADALLRRHRGTESESERLDDELTIPLDDLDDDLPILTEVVDEDELSALERQAATEPPPVAPSAPDIAAAAPAVDTRRQQQAAHVAEQLIELDTEIGREVEAWLANELPQILSRELDALAEKVRSEALAQLRATLLPSISERIARRLDRDDG
ncbi:hypothetical protein dqs_3046 [Azoarcus olearius]|uniref:hypothetical protein n=1 Tax=Azoarcus sp. (strain BH72) TaxID=418699 RepID=UPI0008060EC7|nr:hypothetical protein [Azoarcus olearius]ANQ86074.1 hypothetical protein dqs_3046 [Azoarcus olearius]